MAAKSKTKPTANGVPTPPGDVLTLTEAATLLRVPEDGLKGDADVGKLPGRLIAGEWRFSRTALLEWLSSATCEETSRQRDSLEPHVVIKKAKSNDNTGLLLSLGVFADDETLEPMIEEIYQARKRNPIGS